MQPVEIQLPDHTHGDTWEGLTIGPVLFNGVQPLYALVDCRLYFRKQNGAIGYKIKLSPAAGEGQLVIDNATTWLITVPAQDLPLAVGPWPWDFETTDADGITRTLYKGIQNITREQSHD